jgi:hypothetical protein
MTPTPPTPAFAMEESGKSMSLYLEQKGREELVLLRTRFPHSGEER